MSVEESHILKALGNVEDPDLKKDLVSLNMIKDLSIDGNNVRFTVVLTTPACPLKEYLKNACLKAIEEIDSELEVEINMTSNVTSTRDNTPMLPGVKNIIAIASGKGGVGKSTVAANLAVALANSGASVGLIDADIYGPSIHTMFNVENEKPQIFKKGEKHLIIPLEQYGVKLISIGVLTPADNPVVWRGPMASSAFKQFISDVEWGPLDYMLIDLPPGASDIHLTLVQTLPVTGAIIVTTPQKVAVTDATKGLAMFKQPQINVPILGIIENMAYFTPEELPENKYYIFGQDGGKNLAEKFDVELLGQIPLVQNIREGGDSGYPAVLNENGAKKAFIEVAEAAARQIAIRNANFEATKKVEMKA